MAAPAKATVDPRATSASNAIWLRFIDHLTVRSGVGVLKRQVSMPSKHWSDRTSQPPWPIPGRTSASRKVNSSDVSLSEGPQIQAVPGERFVVADRPPQVGRVTVRVADVRGDADRTGGGQVVQDQAGTDPTRAARPDHQQLRTGPPVSGMERSSVRPVPGYAEVQYSRSPTAERSYAEPSSNGSPTSALSRVTGPPARGAVHSPTVGWPAASVAVSIQNSRSVVAPIPWYSRDRSDWSVR